MMSGMTDRAAAVSAAQFAQIYGHCKNWGRWGADDQRGVVNLITPERVVAAAACHHHERWQFLLVAPLRIAGGTGSPVNPIAVF